MMNNESYIYEAARQKIYRCQFCKYTNTEKQKMGRHYEMKHRDLIRPDMSGYQWFYFLQTKKDHGECIMCKSNTDFNEQTMKYSRFCNNPICKQQYREIFKNRMISKYGKIHLLNDPEKQKEMLSKRRISGSYKWSDGSVTFTYTGSYELDFLKYLDTMLKWKSSDIISPSPHIYTYRYKNNDHFYIPDFYIPSMKLEIEIKDDGSALNINAESREKDKIKDELMRTNRSFMNYLKIINKDYREFKNIIQGDDIL